MIARTINDILSQLLEAKARVLELHQAIMDDVASDAELSGLNSTSRTSIFRLMAFVVAVVMWLQEAMWQEFQTEVDNLIASAVPGTDTWLAAEAKKFQFGDALVIDPITYKYSYQVDDPEKRIIAASAVQANAGLALVKVARLENGELAALLPEQLTAFQAFLNRICVAGSNVRGMSASADLLRLPVTVYYDPLFQKGEVQAKVETAIKSFLKSIPFNGEIRFSKLVDVVQEVTGVKDVVLGTVQAKSVSNADFVDISRLYFPLAGYAVIAPEYPLTATITYSAE